MTAPIITREKYEHYKRNQGYVYLVHAKGTNRYKIGRSINPLKRLDQLQGQSPFPLIVEDCVWSPDSILLEKQLHDRFCDFRVHGEWFELEDKEYINKGFRRFRNEFPEVVKEIFDCIWQRTEYYWQEDAFLDYLVRMESLKNDKEFFDRYEVALKWAIEFFLLDTTCLVDEFVLKATFLVSFYKIKHLFSHFQDRKSLFGDLCIIIASNFQDFWEPFEQGYGMGEQNALVVWEPQEEPASQKEEIR